MIRLCSARLFLGVAACLVVLGLSQCQPVAAQQAPPQARSEGQFFTIEEPITSEVINRVRTQTLHYLAQTSTGGEAARPVLIFEIRPGRANPAQTEFGAARDLAEFISTKLSGARQTVAFLPRPVSGYPSLVALACGEIVMGSESTFGPITPEGQEVDPLAREYVRILAHRTGREEDLLLGMVDRNANLLKVNTGDRQVHYVLAARLDEFRRTHQVSDQQPAWEGGQRGILSSERARSEGFAKRNADERPEVANMYNLAGRAAVDDPTLDQVLSPVWIRVTGPLDTIKESYLKRRIEQARQEKVNLIFFEINSEGGLDGPADNIAEAIADIKDMKTVAYINDRALGVAALVPLACDKIVFGKQARMGDVSRLITGHGGQSQPLS
jgi:membrane-bound serine protease (ClpP class)